jgi:hypothetical protein
MERIKVQLHLTAAELAELAEVAAAADKEPAELVRDIIGRWIGGERPKKQQRPTTSARMAILADWWSIRRTAKRRGRSMDTATDEYVARIPKALGGPITRATLCNWDRRWRDGGLAALADNRQRAAERKPGAFAALLLREWWSRRAGTVAACYRSASAKAKGTDISVPSIRTASRIISRARGRSTG